jgi:hypothetical protein
MARRRKATGEGEEDKEEEEK